MGRQRQEGPASKDAERLRNIREERAAQERQLRHEQHRQRQAELERRQEILGSRELGLQRTQFARAAQQAAALLEDARRAAQEEQHQQAWYQAHQRAAELERQVQLAQNLIQSLQEAACSGGRTHEMLQKALAEKARVSSLLAALQSRMQPQQPRARAVHMCEMAQAMPAPHHNAHAEPQTPAADEQTSEPTPASPQPAPTAQPQQWRLCARVHAISAQDQLPKNQGGHGYPPVTLRLKLRRAKRSRETTISEPWLGLSPKPLGPTSFHEAALAPPPQPMSGSGSFTMQHATSPQQSEQSLVQMLHTGGVRLGYVPLHCPAVQQPRRADAACSRPHNPRGHPFVINGFCSAPPPYDECVTPEHSEPDEPHKVLVYATSETE